MDRNKLISKIENGKQVGICEVIQKENAEFLYKYAIQKINGKYYVYTDEINIDTFYSDELKGITAVIFMYDTLEDFLSDFHHQYGFIFEDFHVSKGLKFFNSDLIQYRPDLIHHKR